MVNLDQFPIYANSDLVMDLANSLNTSKPRNEVMSLAVFIESSDTETKTATFSFDIDGSGTFTPDPSLDTEVVAGAKVLLKIPPKIFFSMKISGGVKGIVSFAAFKQLSFRKYE
jgi:hypothetical protein